MYQYSYLVEQVEVLLSQFKCNSRDSPTHGRIFVIRDSRQFPARRDRARGQSSKLMRAHLAVFSRQSHCAKRNRHRYIMSTEMDVLAEKAVSKTAEKSLYKIISTARVYIQCRGLWL